MRRLVPVLLAGFVLVAVATPVRADVTITSSVSLTTAALGKALTASSVVAVKGTKARLDNRGFSDNVSILVDTATGEQWRLDSASRTVQAIDLARPTDLPVNWSGVKTSITPTGKVRTILGLSCSGLAIDVTMPVTLAGQSLSVKLTGTVWTTSDGPGAAEWRAFSARAAKAGFQAPAMNIGLGSQAISAMQKALADAGLPLEEEMHVTFDGLSAEMAQAIAQIGEMRETITVTAISTDPILDEKFVIPAGYTKKK